MMEKDRRDDSTWAEDVDLVKLQFTDLFGQLKSVEIMADKVHTVLKEGYAINRFALEGLKNWEGWPALEELENEGKGRELFLKPDFTTYQLLPWESGQENVARIICDVCTQDGTSSWADSRGVFKNIIKRAEDMGLQVFFDFQCEFYLFHTDDDGRPTIVTHEVAGYYDAGPIDLAENVRRDMMLNLSEAGIEVESAHHGLTPGQHCFVLPAKGAVEAADYLLTFKSAVKRIAKRHGLHAAFMPKPNMSGDGSGLHVGIEIRNKDGKDVTKETAYFRTGILKHLRDMMMFTNPIVNSYKRLAAEKTAVFQPEFPAAIWEKDCDKAVRIVRDTDKACRLEVLFPDPAVNPYLALGAMLSAGLDGIAGQMDENSCAVSPDFPETLGIVIREFEHNSFAKETFGEKLCSRYLEGRKNEWERFCAYVTDWETKEYLYKC